jgi:chondroitin 4-sulfotransferase 11
MIIDHKKKFVFVAIPKTASTSIIKRFNFAIKKDPEKNHLKLSEIPNIKTEFKHYFKFCFVRNPYDRLVSAYYDLSTAPGHIKWSYPILKYKNFTEFVKNLDISPCKKFVHLLPQNEFISLDDNNSYIDFIGKFENIESDLRKIEKKIKVDHQTLHHHRKGKKNYKLNILEKFLIKIKILNKKKLSFMKEYNSETKEICYRFYKKDFEIFNYEK